MSRRKARGRHGSNRAEEFVGDQHVEQLARLGGGINEHRTVVPIWERSEFAGLSPDERKQLDAASAVVRAFLRWRSGRPGGQPMFFAEFQAAYRQVRTIAHTAADRGVTAEQLADALQMDTQAAELFMTRRKPPV